MYVREEETGPERLSLPAPRGGATVGQGPAESVRAPRAEAPPPTVSLIVPARNEASNIAWVLEQVPDCVDEIVLVDGRSTDATVVTARSVRPDLKLVNQEGKGKGDAMRAGFFAASGDVLVAIDADGSMTPQEIPHYLYFLTHGYDYVKGSRFMGGGGSTDITWMRRTGNKALLRLVNHLHRAPLTDLCYGYMAFHRRYLSYLDLTREGFEVETSMTISALRSGLRIAEVPSMESPRRHGESNLRTFRDGTRVLRTVLRNHESGVSGHAVQGLRRRVHREVPRTTLPVPITAVPAAPVVPAVPVAHGPAVPGPIVSVPAVPAQ